MIKNIVSIFLLSFIFSCSEEPSVVLPTVTTITVTKVDGHTAIAEGEVVDIGDSELTAIGLVAGEGAEPTLVDGISSSISELALGTFISELAGLRSNTGYYLRAYATNKAGTAYGESILIRTLVIIPSVLEFNMLTEIKGFNLTQAIGFAGSEELQSIFLANRQLDRNVGHQSEKLYKYDLLSGDTTTIFNPTLDYISKEIEIIDNQPIVIGSQYVSTYDFSLTTLPKVDAGGKKFSRHGTAQMNDSIYVFGGDLDAIDSDKIWRWDLTTKTYKLIASMPGPKSYADGEIVDNHLFIFGGQQEFSNTQPENTIYDYSFTDNVFETYHLPQLLYQSFTAQVGELIYLAGHYMPDRYADNTDIFFGVFNTVDKTFTEISINLTDEGDASIWALTAIGNELYVVYGDPTLDSDAVSGEQTFTIQKAEIP